MLFDVFVSPPRDWLSTVDTGGWPQVTQKGMLFVKGDLVPFLINGSLFLVIILSLIFLLVGSVMWIISGGEKEGLAKAKSTITYAIIGLILGLSALIILSVLGGFLGFNFLGN